MFLEEFQASAVAAVIVHSGDSPRPRANSGPLDLVGSACHCGVGHLASFHLPTHLEVAANSVFSMYFIGLLLESK